MACSPLTCVVLYFPQVAQPMCPALGQVDGIVGTSNSPPPWTRKQIKRRSLHTFSSPYRCPACVAQFPCPPLPRRWHSLLRPHTLLAPARWEAQCPTPAGGPSRRPLLGDAATRLVQPPRVLSQEPQSAAFPRPTSTSWASQSPRRPPPEVAQPAHRGAPALPRTCQYMCCRSEHWPRLLNAPPYMFSLSSEHRQKVAEDVPGGTVVKNMPANAGDTGSIPGPGRSHMPRSN
ncbi:uncharacterized protein LOC130705788 [Balaenoptera acutorostrata]|uniref:Uncharacterized protein LOC130705788 n=1 Tax=Balaenoptera acutorostrata TaxID=9767 RepID=A0ABM3SML2_BALAC|nr:uncharacterized protein LOC130705788 [Balaenoptera acutorostrata]